MRRGFLLTFLIILLFLSLPICGKNLLIAEMPPPLNGTVSVYYDSNGNKCVHVKSYKKKNGTQVEDYYRSFPRKNKFNSRSTEEQKRLKK